CLDVAECNTAGDIGQDAVEAVAETPAHGSEPAVGGPAAQRAKHVGLAVDVGPVQIALDADDPGAALPVVTDRTADEATADIETAEAVPMGGPPRAAAVDADIEAAPIVERVRHDWRRAVRGRIAALKIGCVSRPRQGDRGGESQARENERFH